MHIKRILPALTAALLVSTSALAAGDDAALAHARKEAAMLDDLYKTAVVLITEHYVKDPTSVSAATAAKLIFKAMKEKGWPETRIIGFTDLLFNAAENAPKAGFETQAKEKILAGAASHSEVVTEGGKRYLNVVTAVPVVMDKCTMCHGNFKGQKGAIGALSYKVAVD